MFGFDHGSNFLGRWGWLGFYFKNVKHCLDFSLVFSAPLPVWRNLFSASGIFCSRRYLPGCTGIFWLVKGTSQAALGSSDQQKVPASLSLFLNSEKIPALLYVRKGPKYRPFGDFQPDPSACQPWAQISNHRRACTQALLLYVLTLLWVGYWYTQSLVAKGYVPQERMGVWKEGLEGPSLLVLVTLLRQMDFNYTKRCKPFYNSKSSNSGRVDYLLDSHRLWTPHPLPLQIFWRL
jgi:hypothetical protein